MSGGGRTTNSRQHLINFKVYELYSEVVSVEIRTFEEKPSNYIVSPSKWHVITLTITIIYATFFHDAVCTHKANTHQILQ